MVNRVLEKGFLDQNRRLFVGPGHPSPENFKIMVLENLISGILRRSQRLITSNFSHNFGRLTKLPKIFLSRFLHVYTLPNPLSLAQIVMAPWPVELYTYVMLHLWSQHT